MSNSRERVLKAFNYENPDKIPVLFGWSDSGLHTHREKLVDLFGKYQSDNPVDKFEVLDPNPETINKDGEYYEKKVDDWKTEWEYRIFGIVGHPSAYPFKSWEDAIDYEFPKIPEGMNISKEDDKENIAKQKENFAVFRGWISVWEKLHTLRPMDEVMMDLCMEEPAFMDFLERLVQHQIEVINYHLEVGADIIIFGDDWGAQTGPLISPDSFKKIYKPIYKRLFDIIHAAGKKVMFHSCGNLGYVMDELIELGIDGIWPQIASYDLEELTSKLKENKVAMYVHPDRQYLIPNGSTKEIEEAIKKYCDHFKKLEGGAIFNLEVENDAPFENIETLFDTVFANR